MTYRRFEDLPVWNAAIDLAIRVYDLAKNKRLGDYSGLRNQIERAALSISNNIAEGFERGTMAELISFLYVARGSAGEVRSMVLLLERMRSEIDLELAELKAKITSISRQLGSWIGSLENSSVKGSRSLTDQQKDQQASERRRGDFLDQLHRLQSERTNAGDWFSNLDVDRPDGP